jgi:hypothetical protein
VAQALAELDDDDLQTLSALIAAASGDRPEIGHGSLGMAEKGCHCALCRDTRIAEGLR